MPLLMMVFALMLEQPRRVVIEREENEVTTYVDDELTVSLRVRVEDGVGLITLADTIPEHFELLDGNNFTILWKSFKKVSEKISFKVKCTKRGIYNLGPVKWESRHALMLKQTVIGSHNEPLRVTVKHRPLNVRRMRSIRTLSKIPLPLGSLAKLGITTTDFQEIRNYVPGDSYRHVNWKATARSMLPHRATLPKVNEYEREGKKVVWIFLDRSANMALGPSIRNTFEYAVEATSGLARFYLERDCMVGLCIFNGEEKIVFPDVGRRQYHRIMRELTAVELVKDRSSINLKEAVRKCRRYLLGTAPLSIIVTTILPENFRQIVDGIKEIRKYIPPIRGRTRQIIVINVIGYDVAARDIMEIFAANLLRLRSYCLISEVKRAGVSVISWNPKIQSFAEILLMGLRAPWN